MEDFDYLDKNVHYFDSSCQSLRPKQVIDAMNEYYTKYNSCGSRVKYLWGQKVHEEVEETRDAVLDLLKLKKKDYFVSFTLNTSYGINLILSQLEIPVSKVITSEIEHNSVFVPTMIFAEKNNIERVVLPREDDGSISLSNDFRNSLVVVNATSNIDGRRLENIKDLVKTVKKQGGYIIIDAAQALGAEFELLQKIPADAIVSSGHKMYSASLGIIIMRKDFSKFIKNTFVGGGMVADVFESDFEDIKDDFSAKFEAGLQGWAEIIALKTAISWLKNHKKISKIKEYSEDIFEFLQNQKGVHLVNKKATSVISFYHENLDAHLIARALGDEGIMLRSGYFCCHYYLKNLKKYPHLVRISLGLHNTEDDVKKIKEVLERIFE